jgi:uncharacterized protein YraI
MKSLVAIAILLLSSCCVSQQATLTHNTNLRTAPSTSGTVVRLLRSGETISIVGTSQGQEQRPVRSSSPIASGPHISGRYQAKMKVWRLTYDAIIKMPNSVSSIPAESRFHLLSRPNFHQKA